MLNSHSARISPSTMIWFIRSVIRSVLHLMILTLLTLILMVLQPSHSTSYRSTLTEFASDNLHLSYANSVFRTSEIPFSSYFLIFILYYQHTIIIPPYHSICPLFYCKLEHTLTKTKSTDRQFSSNNKKPSKVVQKW